MLLPHRQTVSSAAAREAFLGRQPIPNLDALRGLAIFWVLLHHVPPLPESWPWPLHVMQENGRHGVSFFFAISGFLICTLFLREERATGHVSLLKFYGRRVLRLMPLYYLALLLECGLVLGVNLYSAENRALFIEKLPSYIFYYSNVVPNATQGPFFFAWSLAVEEQFYLLFGLFFRWLTRGIVIAICVALLAVKVAAFWTYGPGLLDSQALRIAFSYQESILLGVMLAFVMNTRAGFEVVYRVLARPVSLALTGLGIAALCLVATVEGRSSAHAQAVYVLMTLFIAGASLRPNLGGVTGRLLSHVGKVSYGMYLFHMLVINGARRLFVSPVLVFAVSAPASILLATLSYRYIESPIMRYRAKLEPRPKAPPAAPEGGSGTPERRPSVVPVPADA